MSRFFVSPEKIGARTITLEDPQDLRHMRKALRLKPGDEVDVSDGLRWEYRARIEFIDEGGAALTILDKQAFSSEPSTRVTLFQGIPKQGKMETIVQKCVELGVHRIVPVFMDRSVVVDRGKMEKKTERWQKVAGEACKQCRRGIIPEVSSPLRMEQAVEELEDYDLVLIPYENEEGRTIKDVLRKADSAGASKEESGIPRVALFIGPEGGFSEEEVREVTARGGQSVSLGKTTLRTETAGPATLAMILYEMEL